MGNTGILNKLLVIIYDNIWNAWLYQIIHQSKLVLLEVVDHRYGIARIMGSNFLPGFLFKTAFKVAHLCYSIVFSFTNILIDLSLHATR